MAPTINDLWYYWLQSQLPAGVVAGTSAPVPGSAFNAYSTDSIVVSTSVTAPGAGAVIATTGNLTGLYEVEVQVSFAGSGTPVAADVNNMQVQKAGVGLFIPAISVTDPRSDIHKFIVNLNVHTIRVTAIGAGTASVNYFATIIANKLS